MLFVKLYLPKATSIRPHRVKLITRGTLFGNVTVLMPTIACYDRNLREFRIVRPPLKSGYLSLSLYIHI